MSTAGTARTAGTAGTAFVFPGQGSQYPGMGRELRGCPDTARALVPAAEEATGLPLEELMDRADAATIADPEVAQLLVFVTSTVLLRALAEAGHRPSVVAGHSLGEYSALVAGGVLGWAEALRLVAVRGRAMSEAATRSPGTMAAVVGLPLDVVDGLCADVTDRPTGGDTGGPGDLAVLANLNSPRQAVVSGTPGAVDAVVARAKDAGALRARLLPVGGAYHTPLMAPAEQALAPRIADAPLRAPDVPVASSVTGALVENVEKYRADLATQVTSPVRWRDTVDTLLGAATGSATHTGVTFVEVGPHRVLTGLDREMARDARHLTAHQAFTEPVTVDGSRTA